MAKAETLRNTSPLGLSLHARIVLLIMAISLVSIVFISAISIESGQQQLRRDVGQRLNVIASAFYFSIPSGPTTGNGRGEKN